MRPVENPSTTATLPPAKRPPPRPPFRVRRAGVQDVVGMASIINGAAELGQMLPKSHAALYENLREFRVAVDADGQVVGVCGLSIVWSNLAEVISLAVLPTCRGQGLGRRLVSACMAEARRLGIRKVMTLTYQQRFFERLGFGVVDRMALPMKVWSVCVQCPKNQACDEIAMIRVFEEIPDAPAPIPQKLEHYEAPVQITVGGKSSAP